MVLNECKVYYNNGQLWKHYFSNQNEEYHLLYQEYYADGQLSAKIMFDDGFYNGERIQYDREGNIIRHEVHFGRKNIVNYDDLSEIDKFELSLKWGIIWF